VSNAWPTLPSESWFDTLETFHLWTQIVGKIRMAKSPWLNHSWSVPLYVTSRGLGTSLIPYENEGFELDFDFVDQELELHTTTGETRSTPLKERSVADFYAAVMDAMRSVDMPVEIRPVPTEIPETTPFPEDSKHTSYDPEHAKALWRALLQASRVMQRFRAGYRGKASPVHFFWGSFDLAVTRFSGRTAPDHSGGLPNFPLDVAQEAYSHEVSSVGFWPGNREAPNPIFYAYAYPTPDGFKDAKVAPEQAMWLDELGEFILPYSAVATAEDPDAALLAFFESTHAAAADLAKWDRKALECNNPHGPDWWINRPHR
jgi:hypothetical protein